MGALELLLESAGGGDPCTEDDRTIGIGPGAATYTTAPFAKPKVVAGPIDATLYATSTRPDTEFVVTLEDVAPSGRSTPITSGALLGSFRKVDRSQSWTADGRPLLPYHPYTRASSTPVPTGEVTRFDVEVFPTFAKLAAGHRLRLTLTTSDVPHLTPIPAQTANLVGGVYQVQHNANAASYLNVPIAPASAFDDPCGICR
jgi:putative CocE/NonD family hydrolase